MEIPLVNVVKTALRQLIVAYLLNENAHKLIIHRGVQGGMNGAQNAAWRRVQGHGGCRGGREGRVKRGKDKETLQAKKDQFLYMWVCAIKISSHKLYMHIHFFSL